MYNFKFFGVFEILFMIFLILLSVDLDLYVLILFGFVCVFFKIMLVLVFFLSCVLKCFLEYLIVF